MGSLSRIPVGATLLTTFCKKLMSCRCHRQNSNISQLDMFKCLNLFRSDFLPLVNHLVLDGDFGLRSAAFTMASKPSASASKDFFLPSASASSFIWMALASACALARIASASAFCLILFAQPMRPHPR